MAKLQQVPEISTCDNFIILTGPDQIHHFPANSTWVDYTEATKGNILLRDQSNAEIFQIQTPDSQTAINFQTNFESAQGEIIASTNSPPPMRIDPDYPGTIEIGIGHNTTLHIISAYIPVVEKSADGKSGQFSLIPKTTPAEPIVIHDGPIKEAQVAYEEYCKLTNAPSEKAPKPPAGSINLPNVEKAKGTNTTINPSIDTETTAADWQLLYDTIAQGPTHTTWLQGCIQGFASAQEGRPIHISEASQ